MRKDCTLIPKAILNCKHSARKEVNTRVEWKKVLGSDVSFVYFDGAFVGRKMLSPVSSSLFFETGTFKGRAEMLESSIRIKNVTRKDTGKYRCEISASTDQGQEAAEIEISLSVLGRIINEMIYSILFQRMTLECITVKLQMELEGLGDVLQHKCKLVNVK
ncbi:hypothetical protein lerEdw1_011906 [Lerista edwardsae]|nr:hypothetical protein lerEdw1_011906 [Lerista edwardsae]